MPRARSGGHSAPIVVVSVGGSCNRPPDRTPEVGEIFRSIAWAECSTGINRSQIVAQLSGIVPQARGVIFNYYKKELDGQKPDETN